MAEILKFPNKKSKNSKVKVQDDVLIEEHRIKLLGLYAQMEHVVKEINYHKEVLALLEKGRKK
jgi:hypothetical protein